MTAFIFLGSPVFEAAGARELVASSLFVLVRKRILRLG